MTEAEKKEFAEIAKSAAASVLAQVLGKVADGLIKDGQRNTPEMEVVHRMQQAVASGLASGDYQMMRDTFYWRVDEIKLPPSPHEGAGGDSK